MSNKKNVDPVKSEIAKRSAATRNGRPTIKSGDPMKIIKRLEKDGQPWIIMRYPYSLKLAPELADVCYEIVIWQTCEGDYGYSTFEVPSALAKEIIAEYALTERKRYKEEGCIIWAKDDRLQELHRKYVKEVERLKRRADGVREMADLMRDNAFVFSADELPALLKKAVAAERAVRGSIDTYTESYLKKNNIIIYNI